MGIGFIFVMLVVRRRSDDMNIAVISLFMPTGVPGGAALQAHQISNELVRRGHGVTVFSIWPAAAGALYRTRIVPLPKWGRWLRHRNLGTTMLSFPWAVAHQRFEEFDVIHAHGDSHFLSTLPPIVRTFHSFGLDQMLHATTWRRRVGMAVIYPFELLSGLRARIPVVVSRNMQRYYPLGATTVIPNAVDLSLFHPGGKSPHPSLLFVAGMYAGHKRGELLVRQFIEVVRARFPTAQLWMVCPGPGPEAAGVVWLGTRLDASDLAGIYRRAWVFCQPSGHETFGVPYIEAMASGTAVVSARNSGAIEVLEDGRFGEIADDHALGTAILRLLDDTARRRHLETDGLGRAKAFSLTTVVDRYESLFASLASESAGR
jgi:glycosyltransferase involved in cell wall biosynthesis